MYVCVCRAVTDRQIKKAIENGVRSMRELRQQLGVCSACGKCGPCAKELLAQPLATPPAAGSAVALLAQPAL